MLGLLPEIFMAGDKVSQFGVQWSGFEPHPNDLIPASLCSYLVGREFCGRMQAQGEHACVMGMM